MGKKTYEKRGGIYPVMDKNGKQARDKHGRLKWLVQAYCGERFNPKKNKVEPKIISKRVSGTKADAKKVRLELENEAASTLNVTERNMTLDEFIPTWVRSMELEGKASQEVIHRNQHLVEHVAKYIGHFPLRNIDAHMIADTIGTIKDDKSLKGGEGLSGTTLNMIYSQTKRLFELALDYDLIAKNPCNRVASPKKNDANRRSLTADEYASFMDFLNKQEESAIDEFLEKESRMSKLGRTERRESVVGIVRLTSIAATRIALNTGARRGEILALAWEDIHFGKNPRIEFRHSLTTKGIRKAPKTKSSVRTVEIDYNTAFHLQRLKALEKKYLPSVIGLKFDDSCPVCCNDRGGWHDPNHFSRWWRDFRESAGMPELHFHELRHSVGSLLIANNLDVEKVRKRLGHAKSTTTLAYYVHDTGDEGGREAANIMSFVGREGKAKPRNDIRAVRSA